MSAPCINCLGEFTPTLTNYKYCAKCLHLFEPTEPDWQSRALVAEQKLEEAEYTTILGAFRDRDRAVAHADLMKDEFKRIIAISKCNTDWHNASEVEAICERAMKLTDQTISVIVQRDAAEQERDKLKSELQELKAHCTHPQIHVDYYGWRKAVYENDSLASRMIEKHATVEGAHALLMFAYSSAREELRAILERIEKEKK